MAVTVSGRKMRLVATLVYRAVSVGDTTAVARAARENKQVAGGDEYVRRGMAPELNRKGMIYMQGLLE